MGIRFDIPEGNTFNVLDLDAYVMMVAFAATEEETEEDALHAMDVMIDRSREMVPAANELGYLTASDRSNFRYSVAKTPVIIKCSKDGYFGGERLYKKGEERIYQGYKANRVNLEKPLYFNRLREYVIDIYGAVVVKGIEVDDELGIQATVPGRIATIHTHDKDLNMVRVPIYNVRTRTLHIYTEDLLEKGDKGKIYGRGLSWFYCQMLTGDSGDNIPGIPKYGPVSAFKALTGNELNEHKMCNIVWEIYKRNEGGCIDAARDRFLEIAQLLWMHTTEISDIKSYMEKSFNFN